MCKIDGYKIFWQLKSPFAPQIKGEFQPTIPKGHGA